MAVIRNIIAAVTGALSLAGAAFAQTSPAPVYTPTSLKAEAGLPRTPDGRPDLQGVWESPYLGGLTGIPFITPASLVITEAQSRTAHQTLVRTMSANPLIALDPEIVHLMESMKGFPVVRGERRSRLLVLPANGVLPLTPAAQAEMTRALLALTVDAFKADNPEDRAATERCMAQGGVAPFQIPVAFSPLQFVQTKDHFVIHSEIGNELRIAPYASRHGDARLAPPMGDSIARWEGDTLIIETTHSPVVQRVRVTPMGGLIVNPDARVIERFTRVSRDEIVYQFTIEDPKVFSAPWLAEFSLYRSGYDLQPSACHEANYGLANILSGARYEETFPPVRLASWTDALKDETTDPAAKWTRSVNATAEVRAWAVLSKKDAGGEATVGLRIEREKAAANGLSEINVFAVNCAAQQLRHLTVAGYTDRNLSGAKTERDGAPGWVPVTTRPAIALGIAEACG